jgi:hypothetical protein
MITICNHLNIHHCRQKVTMDGVRLEDFDPSWLREQLGIVGQEPSTGGWFVTLFYPH